MWLQVVSLLALGVAGLQVYGCPTSFTRLGSSCYHFSRHTATHPDAHSYCHSMSSHLAVITNAREDGYLRRYLKSHGQGYDYHIGATDLGHEGRWMWEKPRTKVGYTNWAPGQPDNTFWSQHCLEMNKGWGYQWDDVWCHWHLRYICETNK